METINSRNNTINAPRMAATDKPRVVDNVIPKRPAPIIKKATPKPAPELMPSIYGPASGFRNKVCINKPETDKEAPHRIAVKAFGILDSNMMISSASLYCITA